jgi:hypothetical protein
MLRKFAWLLVACLAVFSSAARAQQTGQPLVALINGDLWSWHEGDTALTRLTTDAQVQEMALSPDGTRLAYTAWASITQDAVKREGGIAGGALPSDVWIYDLVTGTTLQVGGQPAGASFFTQGVPDKAVSHGSPAWSPDGKRLAWSELTYPDSKNSLAIYTPEVDSIKRVVENLPDQAGVPVPMPVWWSEANVLVVRSTTLNASTQIEDSMLVYTPDGAPVNAFTLTSGDNEPLDFLPARSGDQPVMLVRFRQSGWQVIDPVSGVRTPAGPPQLVSAHEPEASLKVAFQRSGGASPFNLSFQIQGTSQTQPAIPLGPLALQRVTLSPGGQSAVYQPFDVGSGVSLDEIYVWRDGATVTLPKAPTEPAIVQNFVWGPTVWLASPVDASAQAGIGGGVSAQAAFACPGANAPRLTVGGTGVVLPGEPNNIRSAPSKTAEVVGQIPAGDAFKVLDGPQCADGIVWWKAEYKAVDGWTAESSGGNYFVAPG